MQKQTFPKGEELRGEYRPGERLPHYWTYTEHHQRIRWQASADTHTLLNTPHMLMQYAQTKIMFTSVAPLAHTHLEWLHKLGLLLAHCPGWLQGHICSAAMSVLLFHAPERRVQPVRTHQSQMLHNWHMTLLRVRRTRACSARTHTKLVSISLWFKRRLKKCHNVSI